MLGGVDFGPGGTTSLSLLLLILSGYLLLTSADSNERSPRGTNCSKRGTTSTETTTPQPKVKVVFKPIPKPDGKGSHGSASANEITGKGGEVPDVYGYVTEKNADNTAPCHDPGPEISITTTDSDTWKTKVIIGCTIAAAVEIIIIIVIIAYWREIRWTMRKFACPCDERASRRGDHEAMERAEVGVVRVQAAEQTDLIGHIDEFTEDLENEEPMQTFTHPSRSRTQEALDDIQDTTPV